MKKKYKTALIFILSVNLSGCSLLNLPNSREFAPVIPQPFARELNDTGSIYQTSLGGISLYENIVAHKVGDVITVVLTEKMDSSKNIQNKYQKETTDTSPEPTIFGTGAKWRFPKQLPVPLITTQNLGLDVNIGNDLQFTGTADSYQKNKLIGTVTVTVARVYSNGNLFVRGEKWIGINEGDEYVKLSGIVRPQDINPDNTIESTRIADARIVYSGKGAFSNPNKPGWLVQFLTSPWWPI